MGRGTFVVVVEGLAVVAGSGAREKELDSEARKLLPLGFAGSLEVEVEESTPLVCGAVGVPGTGDRRSEEPVNGFGAEPTTRDVGAGEETAAGTAGDESKTTGSRALNDLFRVSTSFGTGTGSSCSTKLFASDSTPPPPPREERE